MLGYIQIEGRVLSHITHISSTMAASRALGVLVFLFLLHPQPSEAATGPNPRAILKKGRHFNTIEKLVLASDLETPLLALLNITTVGISLFAPTDKACERLPQGFIDNLNPLLQRALLLLHAVPKYYNYTGLRTVLNPAPTFAAGLITVDITVQKKKQYISSGTVTARVKPALYSKFPLSIFPIDAVLIPGGLV